MNILMLIPRTNRATPKSTHASNTNVSAMCAHSKWIGEDKVRARYVGIIMFYGFIIPHTTRPLDCFDSRHNAKEQNGRIEF